MAGQPRLSPATAHRWLVCPGSVALEAAIGDPADTCALENAAAHSLAELALTSGRDCVRFVGAAMGPGAIVVDPAMATFVQPYVDYVRTLATATGGELLVEPRVSIGHLTGEAGAEDTVDAVVLADGEIIVVDLCYDRAGAVAAERNPQLMLYALGLFEQYRLLGDFRRVRLVVYPPRLAAQPAEWACAIDTLLAFGATIAVAAAQALDALRCRAHWVGAPLGDGPYLNPSATACRLCKAQAHCRRVAELVADTTAADLVGPVQVMLPVDAEPLHLARCMARVVLIEQWCRAVRERTEAQLRAGRPVPGFELVQGCEGAPVWSDEAAAEALLRSMRLSHEEMFRYTLISPSAAERLVESGTLGPRQWARLKGLITRVDGRPRVVPSGE